MMELRKPKGILFSTEMVRAILDGRKTQTRRIITVDNDFETNPVCLPPDQWDGRFRFVENLPGYGVLAIRCQYLTPKYQPYNVLWVRETWQYIEGASGHGYAYKAGGGIYNVTSVWRPSIHMPRKAARIFLRVTDVRVERLQDITTQDIKAEGVEKSSFTEAYRGYEREFINLWDSINAKRGYEWEINPFVWVYTFERIEGGGEHD